MRRQISAVSVNKRSYTNFVEDVAAPTELVITAPVDTSARDLALATAVMTAALAKLEVLTDEELTTIISQFAVAAPVPFKSNRDPRRASLAREAAASMTANRPARGPKPPVRGNANADIGAAGAYKAPQPTFGREFEE